MKLIIAYLIVFVWIYEEINAQSHNIQWGDVGPNDKKIFRKIVVKEHSFMKIVTEDVPYNGTENITCIKVTDQYVNGNGGYATLLAGGVGYKDVTLHLKSQRNHGFDFIIEVYGH